MKYSTEQIQESIAFLEKMAESDNLEPELIDVEMGFDDYAEWYEDVMSGGNQDESFCAGQRSEAHYNCVRAREILGIKD